jgi:hypothetical protein
MVTTAETECSLFAGGDDLTEKSHGVTPLDREPQEDEEEFYDDHDGLDDSLSSTEEGHDGSSDRASKGPFAPATPGLTKIPSSLQIPSCTSDGQEQRPPVHLVEPEETKEEEDRPRQKGTEQSEEVQPLRRLSTEMVPYRPSDRSVAVALSPTKPLLRRRSSYGADSVIPLDFSRRGSVRVLPKPDMETIQKRRFDSASGSATTTSTNVGRRVSFDKVILREHRITMGDNPSCSYGTPISLDWDYIDFQVLTLDDYEMHKFCSGRGRPRTLRQLYLNHYQRKNLLQLEGYTLDQIKEGKKETNRTRKQREMTKFLAQAKILVSLEDMVESGRRKVARAMSSGRNKSKEDEKKLLLKVMEGDDTVDTAGILRSEAKLRADVRTGS